MRGPHPAAVAATSDEARRTRSLLDRLVLRVPRILPPLLAAIIGLPGGRVRSRLLEYLYRRAYAAWNRRDWELNTILHDRAGYELVWAQGAVIPGADASYGGVAGYVGFCESWLEAFGDFRFELVRLHDLDRGVIASEIHQVGHGAGSGAAISNQLLSIDEFRRGRVVRQTEWLDAQAGLRAHGLTPADADN